MIIDIDKQVPVLIGRFVPLHRGHCTIIEKVLEIWPRMLILIGATKYGIRTERTPLLAFERAAILRKYIKSVPKFEEKDILVSFIKDVGDMKQWLIDLDNRVNYLSPSKEPVFIVGRLVDSCFYGLPKDDGTKRLTYGVQSCSDISATSVREKLDSGKDIKELVDKSVYDLINDMWKRTKCTRI